MGCDRYDRQTFLGKTAETDIACCTAGVVGLGGGGSHIVQQLAHIGFRRFALYDPDTIEETNINRLVGATIKDVTLAMPKVDIAERLIRGLHKESQISSNRLRWQESPLPLQKCDIIFGCVDGYNERQELEAFSRRFLIPYVDIGIDVNQIEPEPPVISGQVIVSIPGGPCMHCLGFLTEKKLSLEAQKYGDAGKNPQVVWANGIVASTAVGLAVDIVTGWTKRTPDVVYISYEGNSGTMVPHVRLKTTNRPCSHYPPDQVGAPIFKTL